MSDEAVKYIIMFTVVVVITFIAAIVIGETI